MKTMKSVSRREDNWKKYPYLFNECKNLVFQCQCGKKYESFPGLYLHFQRKHGQKISTKFNANQCTMMREQEKIIYRYMLQEKREKEDQQICGETTFSEKQYISGVLSKFVQYYNERAQTLNAGRTRKENKDSTEQIVAEFQNYIFETIEHQSKKESTRNVLYQIPLHMNPFAQGKQLESNPTEYTQISEWLRKNEYTDLLIQMIDYDITHP